MAEEQEKSEAAEKKAPDSEEPKNENEAKEAGMENYDPSSLQYVDGKCFYKDPSSGAEYEWNDEKKEWGAKTVTEKDYVFDGETYCYTDKVTNVKYKWDKEKNEWVPGDSSISLVVSKEDDEEEMESDEEGAGERKKKVVRQDMSKGTYGTDGDTLTYTDPADGTVYLWDKKKSAWFPKLDEDFLAQYQLSYGFTNPDDKEEDKAKEAEVKKEEEEKPADLPQNQEALKRKAQEPTWFDVDDETNNKVYVSNLPTDITEAEFVDLMQKCGLVMKDVDTGKMKVKLYTDPKTDTLKGDALCTYIKVESVGLALTVLDGYDFRGKKIHVERARFTMKGGAYDPSLRPKKKKRKDIEKIKKMQEKLFDWRPEKMVGERGKHEKVVVVKNLFEPEMFDREVSLILEYQADLRDECRKCGDVRKVVIHDRHPEGVAQIFFKEFEGAEACVQLLNGRWFGQRKITAEIWDGKTKYKIAETEEEIKARLEKWDKFLEAEETRKEEERAAAARAAGGGTEESKGGEVPEESGGGKDGQEADAAPRGEDDPGDGSAGDVPGGADGRMDVQEADDGRDSDGTRSSAGSGDETDPGE